MCGIFVSCSNTAKGWIHYDEEIFATTRKELQKVNAERGPDSQTLYLLDHRNLTLEFYGSELQLRGEFPVTQPHVKDGNILCWNGEVFEGLEISSSQNDGSQLMDALCHRDLGGPSGLIDLLSTIEGPYAFAFFHAASQRLYFARDPLGRRSLLLHTPTAQHQHFLLSSVSAGQDLACDFTEVSAKHIYYLDIGKLSDSGSLLDMPESGMQKLSRKPSEPKDPSHAFGEITAMNMILPPQMPPLITSFEHPLGALADAVEGLIYHLDRSVMLQVKNIPAHKTVNGKARLAILFSGGIDSSVLAFLAHRYIPLDEPIDLLNVAFENPRKAGKSSLKNTRSSPQMRDATYQVPDRITGQLEVEELRRLCCGRVWNFVEIDVPYAEYQAALPQVLALMLPGHSVMDLSLAVALFFAARGAGIIQTSTSEPVTYRSYARVLLSGLGSDELLGGYGRHRTVFNTGGWGAVVEELQKELDRLPERNLGRDDRVISSHGKESRHPFLSLSVVSYLAALPVHFKMDPRLEQGFGDKMLLRLATWKLGLLEASRRKKKAMQFGSHSARMHGEKRGDVDI